MLLFSFEKRQILFFIVSSRRKMFWPTYPIFWCQIFELFLFKFSLPILTKPSFEKISPNRRSSIVDFPEPEGPQ